MEEVKTIFVFSDAGYGRSVRGYYPNQGEADAKMARLAKKGHTDIESHVAIITEVNKYEVKA